MRCDSRRDTEIILYMGAGASIGSPIDRTRARQLAAEAWNEARFDALADGDGCISPANWNAAIEMFSAHTDSPPCLESIPPSGPDEIYAGQSLREEPLRSSSPSVGETGEVANQTPFSPVLEVNNTDMHESLDERVLRLLGLDARGKGVMEKFVLDTLANRYKPT